MKRKRGTSLAAICLIVIGLIWVFNAQDAPRATRAPARPAPARAIAPSRHEATTVPGEAPAPEFPPSLQRFTLTEFDGRAVSGLKIGVQTGNRKFEVVSDDQGLFQFVGSGSDQTRLAPLDAAWQLTKTEFAASSRPQVVVVYRHLRIEGLLRVQGAKALDLTNAKVRYSIGARPRDNAEGAGRVHRLARHGIPLEGGLGVPSADGRFEGTLPAIAGYVVHARLSGWYADGVAVLAEGAGDRVSVVLELKRGTRLSGRLLNDHGQPAAKGTMVHVYITLRGDPKSLTVEEAFRLRGSARCGMTCRVNEQRGESIANFHYVARTEDDGTYSVVVHQQGELTARANAAGHAPATAKAGWDLARGGRMDLSARKVEAPASIEIKVGGVPQLNTRVEIVDMVSRGPQMAVLTKTDQKGCIPSTWLEPGRAYSIGVGEPPAHVVNRAFLRWHGERSIDIVPKGKQGHRPMPDNWW